MKLRCKWFGCEQHEQDWAPVEYATCYHCGESLNYEHMAGITRWNDVKDWLSYWLFRKWWPTKCMDCGKRFGHHDGCIPF